MIADPSHPSDPSDKRTHLSLHDVHALAEFLAEEARGNAFEAEQSGSVDTLLDALGAASECAHWIEGLRTLAEDMQAAAAPTVGPDLASVPPQPKASRLQPTAAHRAKRGAR